MPMCSFEKEEYDNKKVLRLANVAVTVADELLVKADTLRAYKFVIIQYLGEFIPLSLLDCSALS